MTYHFDYSILSINYNGDTRVTTVRIVDENTGEVLEGTARRNPADKMDIRLATNLATLRAVRKAILTDLSDCRNIILQYGSEDFDFDN